MEHIDLDFIKGFVEAQLAPVVGDDYAEKIAETDGFIEAVREDVETSSDWETEGTFGLDDLCLAVGRILLKALGNPQ